MIKGIYCNKILMMSRKCCRRAKGVANVCVLIQNILPNKTSKIPAHAEEPTVFLWARGKLLDGHGKLLNLSSGFREWNAIHFPFPLIFFLCVSHLLLRWFETQWLKNQTKTESLPRSSTRKRKSLWVFVLSLNRIRFRVVHHASCAPLQGHRLRRCGEAVLQHV